MAEINSLLGTKTDCSCGHTHNCEIAKVVIGKHALDSLKDLTADYQHIVLVCDNNTYAPGYKRPLFGVMVV